MTRKCGDCALCCDIFSVEEIDKPADHRCEHSSGSRCMIYADRPQPCRDFKCVWLIGAAPKWMKPTHVDGILTVGAVQLNGSQPLEFRMSKSGKPSPRVLEWLREMSEKTLVVVTAGAERTVYQNGRRALHWVAK